MSKKSGAVTLEMLFDRMEAIDADNKFRFQRTEEIFEKIESSLIQKQKEDLDRTLSREANMEGRILKPVNDQVGAAMAAVQATTSKIWPTRWIILSLELVNSGKVVVILPRPTSPQMAMEYLHIIRKENWGRYQESRCKLLDKNFLHFLERSQKNG